MKKAIADVAAFHHATDLPVRVVPSATTREERSLRDRLLDEEYAEYTEARINGDLVKLADAIGDMIYVLIGTALTYGIPLEDVWNEIHRTNMAKVDPTTGKVRRRPDGKILKPEGWTPPRIAEIMEGQKL